MFAARNVDGVWRLSRRRGRLIQTYSTNPPLSHVEIKFSSNAKAKACADELNETLLPAYEQYFDREGGYHIDPWDQEHASSVMSRMIGVIDNYRTKD